MLSVYGLEGRKEMRDFSNLPSIDWQPDRATLARIEAQVLREEPLILRFDPGFVLTVDAEASSCHEESGLLVDCKPRALFNQLAKANDTPALKELGERVYESRLSVSVDGQGHRLIIHE